MDFGGLQAMLIRRSRSLIVAPPMLGSQGGPEEVGGAYTTLNIYTHVIICLLQLHDLHVLLMAHTHTLITWNMNCACTHTHMLVVSPSTACCAPNVQMTSVGRLSPARVLGYKDAFPIRYWIDMSQTIYIYIYM